MTEHLITADGVRLAWDEAGTGAPVLLVHGLGLSRRRWQRQVEALAGAGYRAVRFDLRGFGDSAMPSGPYDMDRLVADLTEMAEHAALDTFHLVGHSLGGMISQRFAVANPGRVRSLALLSTTSHNGKRASFFARAMARVSAEGFDAVISDVQMRAQVEAILAEGFPQGPPPLEHFRKGLEKPNLAHAYAWTAIDRFSVKDSLPTLVMPLLVMHGTADPLIPFVVGQYIHWVIGHSRFVELPGAGHSIQVERADEVNDALLGFLAEVDGAQ